MAQQETMLRNKTLWYDVGKDYLLPVLALVVSIVAIYRTQVTAPEYAIIGRDGTLQVQRGFGQYGLFVEKTEIPLSDGNPTPAYRLLFSKEPDYFEVTTRDKATPEVVHIGPKEYRVHFIAAGFGNPGVECSFKIQAY